MALGEIFGGDSGVIRVLRLVIFVKMNSMASATVVDARRTGVRRGVIEFGILGALYLVYSASRTLASENVTAAKERASWLRKLEQGWHLDLERMITGWFVDFSWLGLAGSYFYATAHYIVTLIVLVWLYLRHPDVYSPARRALVVATVLALGIYLLIPMAPPRLVGYTDVLKLHAASGWWGGDASAPKGLGGLTNQLAAMPSLHAGWALWVAVAVSWAGVHIAWRRLAWAYAVISVVVIIGTGNHWVLDAVAGWLVVGYALWLFSPNRPEELSPARELPEWATPQDDSATR